MCTHVCYEFKDGGGGGGGLPPVVVCFGANSSRPCVLLPRTSVSRVNTCCSVSVSAKINRYRVDRARADRPADRPMLCVTKTIVVFTGTAWKEMVTEHKNIAEQTNIVRERTEYCICGFSIFIYYSAVGVC